MYLASDLIEDLFTGSATIVQRQLRGALAEQGRELALGVLVVEYAAGSS